jgi:hypothetical protein
MTLRYLALATLLLSSVLGVTRASAETIDPKAPRLADPYRNLQKERGTAPKKIPAPANKDANRAGMIGRSPSDTSMEKQMRLQMQMDRDQKAKSMGSNIQKKSSETKDQIIKNMK